MLTLPLVAKTLYYLNTVASLKFEEIALPIFHPFFTSSYPTLDSCPSSHPVADAKRTTKYKALEHLHKRSRKSQHLYKHS